MAPRPSTGVAHARVNVFVLNRCVRSDVAATIASARCALSRIWTRTNAARAGPNNWVHLLPAVTRPSRDRFSSCARRRQGSSLRSARACHAERGLRALTAPARSSQDGNYVMAGLLGKSSRAIDPSGIDPFERSRGQRCCLEPSSQASVAVHIGRTAQPQHSRLLKRNHRLRRSLDRSGVGTSPTSAPLNQRVERILDTVGAEPDISQFHPAMIAGKSWELR